MVIVCTMAMNNKIMSFYICVLTAILLNNVTISFGENQDNKKHEIYVRDLENIRLRVQIQIGGDTNDTESPSRKDNRGRAISKDSIEATRFKRQQDSVLTNHNGRGRVNRQRGSSERQRGRINGKHRHLGNHKRKQGKEGEVFRESPHRRNRIRPRRQTESPRGIEPIRSRGQDLQHSNGRTSDSLRQLEPERRQEPEQERPREREPERPREREPERPREREQERPRETEPERPREREPERPREREPERPREREQERPRETEPERPREREPERPREREPERPREREPERPREREPERPREREPERPSEREPERPREREPERPRERESERPREREPERSREREPERARAPERAEEGASREEECAPQNTCDYERFNNEYTDYGYYVHRNCFCDDYCELFGDCCRDFAPKITGRFTNISSEIFECSIVREIVKKPIVTVNKCPSHWNDDRIRQGCEVAADESERDIFMRWPVSGPQSGFLYRNVFCSVCNGEKNPTFWLSDIQCNTSGPDYSNSRDLDIQKTIDDSLESGMCRVRFNHPTINYRLCKPHISTCSPTYSNELFINQCRDYGTSFSYADSKRIYKNSYCAYCNRENPAKLHCLDTVNKFDTEFVKWKHLQIFPFSILLDVNAGSGSVRSYAVSDDANHEISSNETETRIKTCPKSEVFDPFIGRCRTVYCMDGYIYSNEYGSCLSDPKNRVARPNITLECPLIFLNSSEVVIFANDSARSVVDSAIYEENEYILGKDGGIFVCSNYSQNYTYAMSVSSDHDQTLQFSFIQALVSLVGTIISLIALAIHFTIYMLLPTLRNLPGKNLLSLVSALFVAQLFFLVGVPRYEIYELCVFFAALIHYSFLAAFFWMNVMAYDIWRTFSRQGLPPSGTGNKRFAFYSIYAWLAPLVVIAISLGLNFTDAESQFNPRYGVPICWINKRMALITLFAVPIGVILLGNLVFFGLTVRSIYLVGQTAKLVQKKKEKQRFGLYVKLSFIMGMTWLFGFIAAIGNVEPLWYVFIIFNTLQGLFICIAFICNTKVYKLLVDKFSYLKVNTTDPKETDFTKSTMSSKLRSTSLSTDNHKIVRMISKP
ncbi:unnamed protein product [Owenia fusiformis]|uniref:Uncharacterized protein n=1 Tax=Owenia fusiformis TaxID=6347 RepID=A0A8S4PGZ1_OWEFU|nr:unnamed protein product [Owenia fusiformis]